MRSILLAILIELFLCSAACAMEKSEYIDTNRPSFCQSAIVVPKGSLQIESGTLYQYFPHGINYFDMPETQIRLGLLKHTEFQVFTPNYTLINDPHQKLINGVTDIEELGLKQELLNLKRFQLALIAGVNVPTGNKYFQGGGTQPVIRLPYAIPLGKGFYFYGMESIGLINHGRDVIFQPFAMIQKNFGLKSSLFAEYGGFFAHKQSAQNIAHFGGEYRPNRNQQIDLHWGFGLNQSAPRVLIGAGYSYRFDGLPWN